MLVIAGPPLQTVPSVSAEATGAAHERAIVLSAQAGSDEAFSALAANAAVTNYQSRFEQMTAVIRK